MFFFSKLARIAKKYGPGTFVEMVFLKINNLSKYVDYYTKLYMTENYTFLSKIQNYVKIVPTYTFYQVFIKLYRC